MLRMTRVEGWTWDYCTHGAQIQRIRGESSQYEVDNSQHELRDSQPEHHERHGRDVGPVSPVVGGPPSPNIVPEMMSLMLGMGGTGGGGRLASSSLHPFECGAPGDSRSILCDGDEGLSGLQVSSSRSRRPRALECSTRL